MRPAESEYTPNYKKYVDKVEGDDVIWVLETQINDFLELINSIPEEKKSYSYKEGKWTIAELLGHVIDTERVFAFRALCFARNDQTPLPGFEQDEYMKYSNMSDITKYKSQVHKYTTCIELEVYNYICICCLRLFL